MRKEAKLSRLRSRIAPIGLSLTLLLLGIATPANEPTSKQANQPTVVLAEVASVPIIRSSHSAAATIVLNYLKLTDLSRPIAAVQADIEGATYFCSCKKDLHYWPIAAGLRKWAGANAKPANPSRERERTANSFAIEEKCLRTSDPKEQATFEVIYHEIEAKRPVILTLSFDDESSRSLESSFLSQQRISAVVIGYSKDARELTVLFPEGIDQDKNFSQLNQLSKLSKLSNLSQPTNQPTSELCHVPWQSEVPNVVFTFIRPVAR